MSGKTQPTNTKAHMKYMAIFLAFSLSGCATAPQWLASYYDGMDPCQRRDAQGRYPHYCGAGSAGRTVIYATPQQQPIGPAVGYTKSQ